MSKTFKELLKEERTIFGTWLQIPSPEIAEIFGYAGFEFAIVDNEHSSMGPSTSVPMLRALEAAGVATAIRVPECADVYVKKALDSGASAIVCPGISSVKAAKDFVYYGKYAPKGMRGSCPGVRANKFGMGDISYYSNANNNTALIVQVEGKEGVEVFDEIIAVDGLDGVLLGPVDLSMSLGVPGQLDHPLVTETMKEMVKKVRNKGLGAGMFTGDIKSTKYWMDAGCNFIGYGIDAMMILGMAENTLRELKTLL